MVHATPTTLTLKNIPDAVYERLKTAAEMHRRRMNSDAIVCLEAVLMPDKAGAGREARPCRETARCSAKAGRPS